MGRWTWWAWWPRVKPETLRSRVARLETFRTYAIGRMGALELLAAKPLDVEEIVKKRNATLLALPNRWTHWERIALAWSGLGRRVAILERRLGALEGKKPAAPLREEENDG